MAGGVARIVVVAGHRVRAVVGVITNAIGIGVGGTSSTADVQGVELIAIAIAIARWDFFAATSINGPWSIANTAGIDRAYARVDVVAHAVHVGIRCAGSTTHAEGIVDVAVAITFARRDAASAALTAFIDGCTRVIGRVVIVTGEVVGTIVGVVAESVAVDVGCARTTAHAKCVKVLTGGIARIVVVAGHRVRAVVGVIANAIGIRVGRTGTATHAEGVLHVASAIACSRSNAASAADTALVGVLAGGVARIVVVAGHRVRAVVGVITNAIGIGVGGTSSTADVQGVELIAIAIAIARWDFFAATSINGPWSIANTAGVISANAGVDVITDSVTVCV